MTPDSLYDLPTMASVLEARGETPAPLYACRCKRQLDATAFCCTDGLDADLPRFVCYTCASDAHRRAVAAQVAVELALLPPWESEAGTACKIERDRRVNATLWTTAAGSPLTPECQTAWEAWRIAMHRLTLDHPEPLATNCPDWPAEPPFAYAAPPE